MTNKDIQKAKDNILRGVDIDSASLILESAILDNMFFYGGRVNIVKVATRQILDFICETKNKEYLDLYRENIKQKNSINKAIQQIENIREFFSEDLQADFIVLEEILKGENTNDI